MRKQKYNYQQATYERHHENSTLCTTSFRCTYKNQNLSSSWVMVFSRDLSRWSIGSYVPFLQGSHMWKQYCTVKALLYAAKAVPSKDYLTNLTLKKARKGRWVISPDYRASHPWCFCAIGDVVAQRYDILWDLLWDACHMAGVQWGSRCEGFCSDKGPHYCLEQSMRNPTINLIHEFGNPLRIPYLSCTV